MSFDNVIDVHPSFKYGGFEQERVISDAQRVLTLQQVVAEIDQFITDQISAKDTKSAIFTLKTLRGFLVNLAVYQGINLEVGDGD